jgi:dimeric dUTPase (all-alpha-NTP-PPase superfamily)
MLNKIQISTMIGLQDSMNSKINPNWIVADYNWMLAGAMEMAEAIDHHGWKWWKASVPNWPALRVELVDYWHFVLSKSIVDSEGNYDASMNFLLPEQDKNPFFFNFDSKYYEIANMTLVEKLFKLVGLASVGRFEFYLFQSIMEADEFSWEELFIQYICKNVLNNFRQDNGYKENTYTKIWYDGREDNDHMLDILSEFRSQIYEAEFVNVLEIELKSRYARTLAEK